MKGKFESQTSVLSEQTPVDNYSSTFLWTESTGFHFAQMEMSTGQTTMCSVDK